MEQHPIPQQITSYEFKLIGDMTIKQFGKAAAGIGIAVLINAMPLFFVVKYPLMAIFGLGGLALAFIPFQDRPLEKWLMGFVHSVYAPTIFIWKKTIDYNWLEVDYSKKIDEEEDKEKKPIKDKSKVDEFLQSLPQSSLPGGIMFGNTEEEEDVAKAKEEVVVQPNKVVNPVIEQIKQTTNVELGDELITNDWRNGADTLERKDKLGATGVAVFGSIPMPDTPTTANVLVGMVTDKEGKIVEDAIVEIQDALGNSVRVLKTNQLGQFRTQTPLSSGQYLIITDKDGIDFDRVNVEMNGEIVRPIKIQAI